jgi:hypothetical protein
LIGYDPAVHVKVTVTFELFQSAALGAGEVVATIVGWTRGWTFSETVVVAVL